MHRILADNDAAGQRRAQASGQPRKRPELMARRPGQVWSWDITKLRGPDRGVYYDLYVVLDIFSRPRVSNDNPYSEAAFKTLKYAPVFPDRFGSLADARAFAEQFFAYYNHQHRHCGIGLHTPASVHHGTANQVRAGRQQTLDAAYATHPERFGHRRPAPPKLPALAWINQPSQEALIQTA
jgi:transposase InsO family protein